MTKDLGYLSRNDLGELEYQPPYDETVTVNIGANQTIIIDKLFGPLIAETVRIRLDYGPGTWVVERLNLTTEKWELKAQWDCQETYSETATDQPIQPVLDPPEKY